MRRTQTSGLARTLVLTVALAFACLPLAGCDNPSCAFGGSCIGGGGSGALGSEPATFPATGETIRTAIPLIEDFQPDGAAVDRRTPIVIRFSESMSPGNLNIAFELVQDQFGAIPLQGAALLGDGHLLCLFPIAALTVSSTYTVRFREGIVVSDRTGQAVVVPADRIVGSFTVADADAMAPELVATWPPDLAEDVSATSEIVAVFSRPLDSGSVVDASWIVEVEGAAPASDPAPQPVVLGGLVSDTRVWRWRSTDITGGFASLGTDATVELTLSPTTSAIQDTDGNDLPETSVSFQTAAFSAPLSASITSEPVDAIGIEDVTGPADLAIQVDFEDAQDGDRVAFYMFGSDPIVEENPPTIALVREVRLEAPFSSFTLTADEIDLVRTDSPLTGVFGDGRVTFAFLLRRGAAASPVTLLDVDTTTSGAQSPVLDLTAPTLVGLGAAGTSTTAYTSDLRDLVVVGRASEPLRAAFVTTTLGDNEQRPGVPPPVAGAHASGLFVAAPVPLGIVDPGALPLSFSLTLYDAALNPSTITTADFTQVGVASGGLAGPFGDLTIQVVHAVTHAPIPSAEVFVHEDAGGPLAFVASGVTDAEGFVTLPGALIGDTVVTATATGFGLVTFDGVPTDRLSLPLSPNGSATATVSGQVITTDPTLGLYARSVADTRVAPIGETLAVVNACVLDTTDQRYECPFGPVTIGANQIGAQTVFATLAPSNPFLFSPLAFLKSYRLALPLPLVAPTAAQTSTLSLDPTLDSPTLADEERAVDGPTVALTTVGYAVGTDPRVRVEALSAGLRAPVTVGLGVAFDDGLPPDTWAVRCAYPGAADGIQDVPEDQLGRLVTDGTIDGDLFVRCEAVDPTGFRGGRRPRLSTNPTTLAATLPADVVLVGPDPGLANLYVECVDVLPDALAQDGLYRIVLSDVTGRTWTVWRLDAPDAAGPNFVFRLPYVGAGNTLPLAAGNLAGRVSAFAWPTFDRESFLWTDVEREFDAFSHTASTTVTPP